MKIALLTLGTRGDVQPFAVLGKALQQRGHSVTLCTARNFATLVASYGLSFEPVEADYQTLLDSEEGKKIMKANPLAIRRNLEKWVYPLVERSLHQFYTLARQSDRVVYHVKTLADVFADQFPERMIRAMPVPAVQPTAAFANPAFSGFPIPKLLNTWSYKLTQWSLKMLSKPIRRFRVAHGLPEAYVRISTPFLYGISPAFLPQPSDYPVGSLFTGFWFDNSTEELNPELQQFLQAGPPPLLLTFGSMPFRSRFDLPAALQELATSTRVVIVKGWGLKEVEQLTSNPSIQVIEAAPFNQLFPRVRGVIHHGGIGTTAECLRAGKPMFICPILHPIGDQYFWGQQAHQKGVGVWPVPLAKLSKEQFLVGAHELLHNTSLHMASQQLAAQIHQENGLQEAIEAIETGRFHL
jgi:sterol 3beta-glucosyltransferase